MKIFPKNEDNHKKENGLRNEDDPKNVYTATVTATLTVAMLLLLQLQKRQHMNLKTTISQ